MQQQKKERKHISQRYQNPFDVLGSESEEEVCEEVCEEVREKEEQAPSVRLWSKDTEEPLANRFVMKESSIQSLFQSPFQKGGVKGGHRNKKHRFSKPCFQNEDERYHKYFAWENSTSCGQNLSAILFTWRLLAQSLVGCPQFAAE